MRVHLDLSNGQMKVNIQVLRASDKFLVPGLLKDLRNIESHTSTHNTFSNSYPHACPCGFYSDPVKECTCSAMAISRYQKKISGPLLDRIDIHVEVPRVAYEKLSDKRQAETSETIRKRVQVARERQLERFKGTKLKCNAEMGPNEVREYCQADAAGEKLMKAATQQLHLSARVPSGTEAG
jgi:hypothetical protein